MKGRVLPISRTRKLLLFYSVLLIAGKLLLKGSLVMERTLISFSIFVHLLWSHKHVPRKKTGKQGRDGSYSKEKINLSASSSMRRKQEKRFKY